jgi:hypothetical protein
MLVIEGALYALFPEGMRKAIEAALSAPIQNLRVAGLAAMALGVFIVWMVNG